MIMSNQTIDERKRTQRFEASFPSAAQRLWEELMRMLESDMHRARSTLGYQFSPPSSGPYSFKVYILSSKPHVVCVTARMDIPRRSIEIEQEWFTEGLSSPGVKPAPERLQIVLDQKGRLYPRSGDGVEVLDLAQISAKILKPKRPLAATG